MKRLLSYVLTAVLTLAVAAVLVLRFAEPGVPSKLPRTIRSNPVTMTAGEKLAFKTEIDGRMAGKTAVDEKVRLERVEALLLEYGRTPRSDPAALEAEGVFLLELGRGDRTEYDAGYPLDVTVTAPALFYDGYTGEWIVVCGGWWNSDLWNGPRAGNLGGRNAWGVTYSDRSGEYDSHVSGAGGGLWSSGKHAESYSYTSSRSSGDGAAGIDFELQDHIVTTGLWHHLYVGEAWACFARYAPGFETYEAAMTAYYTCD